MEDPARPERSREAAESKGEGGDSVFFAGLPDRPAPADAEALEGRYARLFAVREAVNKALEEERKAKRIGKSLEAMVTLTAEGGERELLEIHQGELPALFIVSKVALAPAPGPLAVKVDPAPGERCGRCWIYAEDVGADARFPGACGKCAAALA